MLPLSLLALLLVQPLVSVATSSPSTTIETFDEHLHVRPLLDGKVNARFSFVTHSSNPQTHHSLSPAPLLALLRAHQADGFELALTAGSWDHSRWGYPLGQTGGTGAELWAWMGEGEDPDDRHNALLHSVSGLFCASLGQALTNSFTTRPYIPHLTSPLDPSPYHSTSPPSSLCTENLTPFLKLLPSKGRSGISALLKSHRVFEGNWHSMSVKVRREEDGGIRTELGFEVVWDLVGRKKVGGLTNLSLQKIFKSSLPAPFPPASSSFLTLDLPEWQGEEGKDFSLSHSLNFVTRARTGGVDSITWDLKAVGQSFDFNLQHTDSTSFFVFPKSYPLPPLSIHRTLLGSSQTSGAFLTLLTNASPFPRQAVLMEEWPWWVGAWLGERSVSVDGVERDDLLPTLSYTPSLPHTRPTTLLTHLNLPANSTVRIHTPFLKQFLQYNEHLPDASRGFELWAAVLFPLPSSDDNEAVLVPSKIYTTNLLVDLAVPDFSMPYNVIIMTSTVVALFFGSIFNPLTRRLMAVRVEGGSVVGRIEGEDWEAQAVEVEVEGEKMDASSSTPTDKANLDELGKPSL
ncbi:GPI transamidase component PIG-T [Mrakia frigida]|uniref:GPI-anchor transamidase subunit GPI16 n=1 Tax=Mrakia frigida TaxID=29902 RepID=UPI003FCBF3F4